MFHFLAFISALILAPFHSWNLIDSKYYQPVSGNPILPRKDLSNGVCAPGMLWINGAMKQDKDPNPYGGGTVEYLQKTTCTNWINKDFPERCAQFDREQWLKISASLPTKNMNFCIDQFEYPNQEGQYPWIYITWDEAKDLCSKENKRICTESEWTFSCEGPEGLPYPTGYSRPDNICNIDKSWRLYDGRLLMPRDKAGPELDKLWQGDVSGSDKGCKSVFGVFDLVGNVDEFTQKDRAEGQYQSILAGGYWGPVRTRCRPKTRSHSPTHIFYQEGTRCCSDVK